MVRSWFSASTARITCSRPEARHGARADPASPGCGASRDQRDVGAGRARGLEPGGRPAPDPARRWRRRRAAPARPGARRGRSGPLRPLPRRAALRRAAEQPAADHDAVRTRSRARSARTPARPSRQPPSTSEPVGELRRRAQHDRARVGDAAQPSAAPAAAVQPRVEPRVAQRLAPAVGQQVLELALERPDRARTAQAPRGRARPRRGGRRRGGTSRRR